MDFLDSNRDETHPDDIMVRLVKYGFRPEGCWVRICGLGEHSFRGILLNEPDQPFGCHEGDEITFIVQEDKDKTLFCSSDMDLSVKIDPQDLEDGSVLKNAIAVCKAESTPEHFINVLAILRDSFVWIPYTAVLAEADQKRILEMIESGGGDVQSLVGKTLSTEEDVRMIPDILQNGDDFFFPVFITCEDMGEYGEHFSKLEQHFLKAVTLAKNNKKDIKGIVINPFSDAFVVDSKLFDLLMGTES